MDGRKSKCIVLLPGNEDIEVYSINNDDNNNNVNDDDDRGDDDVFVDDENAHSNGNNHNPSINVCKHLYSCIKLLNECMDESMLMGEKGFCTTTITIAMQSLATQDHLLIVKNESVPENHRPHEIQNGRESGVIKGIVSQEVVG